MDGARNLVFGASGYIGTNLVEFLLARGRIVRASARNMEVLEGREWSGVELCEADALEPGTLEPALRDVDTAYYLVHSMAAGKHFPKLDIEAARNFGTAAREAGVRRIVYLGGLTPDDPSSAHLKSRVETGDVLRQSGVPVTELRAGMIIGPGSAAWEVIRDLVNYLPVMITPRWVTSKSTPIALQNLLHYLAEVPRFDATAGETFDIGGPDELTYIDIMRQYGKLVGKRPLIVRVPVLTPRLSSYWLRLVTSVPTNVARALIDGLSQDVIARDNRLAQLIPQQLLTVTEAAEAALTAERQHAVPARWVESAAACKNFRPEYSFYSKQAEGSCSSTASERALWDVICEVGVDGDFFYGRSLWWIRRAMDWLVGGPSFRRGRRHPNELRVGDTVDAWRVISMETDRRLVLLMELKAPGAGVLEFRIGGQGGGSRIVTVHGYWHPAGAWGLLYWYITLPVHRLLFNGTASAIARRAER